MFILLKLISKSIIDVTFNVNVKKDKLFLNINIYIKYKTH